MNVVVATCKWQDSHFSKTLW